jgi:hypothetical protein
MVIVLGSQAQPFVAQIDEVRCMHAMGDRTWNAAWWESDQGSEEYCRKIWKYDMGGHGSRPTEKTEHVYVVIRVLILRRV